jgi:2-methylisocitrate lyase-like PEP mutase family enzyme
MTIGYSVAAYPLTLLSASVKAMQTSLQLLKDGQSTDDMILSFPELQKVVGFTGYNTEAEKYKN